MELTKEQEKCINKEIEDSKTKEQVIEILKKYNNYILKGAQLGRAFEKMYIVEQGFSENVLMEELKKYHPSFRTTNGSDWCRVNQSYLGRKYNIINEKRRGRIYAVKADGYNKMNKINQGIRPDIISSIKSQRCVILDISSNIECDHKDGMKNDWRLNNKENQKNDDFQPLSKTANDAKRQHCKKCLESGKRYDAKKLGYKESYTYGNENTKTCTGCYWYDPKAFNEKISESFSKKS